MPNIEGNVEEDQELELEDDVPIASCTCSQMEPISVNLLKFQLNQCYAKSAIKLYDPSFKVMAIMK